MLFSCWGLELFKVARTMFLKAGFKLGNLCKNLAETKSEDIFGVVNSFSGGKSLRKEEQ